MKFTITVECDDAQMGDLLASLLSTASAPKAEGQKYFSLSPKEIQAIQGVVDNVGYPQKVVADRLNISPKTLRTHLGSCYSKLGLRGATALYDWALRSGFKAKDTPRTGGTSSMARPIH